MQFVKDTTTKAIINNDDGHYKAILAARQAKKIAVSVEQQLADLRADLEELKLQFKSFMENYK